MEIKNLKLKIFLPLKMLSSKPLELRLRCLSVMLRYRTICDYSLLIYDNNLCMPI